MHLKLLILTLLKLAKNEMSGCCKCHVELDLLMQGLNNIKDGKKGTHVANVCNVVDPNSTLCQAHDKVYIGVTMLWEKCVCPNLELQ